MDYSKRNNPCQMQSIDDFKTFVLNNEDNKIKNQALDSKWSLLFFVCLPWGREDIFSFALFIHSEHLSRAAHFFLHNYLTAGI